MSHNHTAKQVIRRLTGELEVADWVRITGLPNSRVAKYSGWLGRVYIKHGPRSYEVEFRQGRKKMYVGFFRSELIFIK